MLQIFKWLMKWSWKLLLSGLSLLVVVMVLLRLAFACLPMLQKYITAEVSERLNTDLSFQEVQADWQYGVPKLSIQGLTLQGKTSDQPGFTIDRFDMELNLRDSLLHRTAVFNSLTIDGVAINLVQDDGARWHLSGVEKIAGSITGRRTSHSWSFLDWINYQKRLDIRDISLNLQQNTGATSLTWKYFVLSDFQGQKNLVGRLESGEGYLDVSGVGHGTRPSNSQWSGSLKAEALDLDKFCFVWSNCNNRFGSTILEADTRIEYRNELWQIKGQFGLPHVAYQDINGHWKTLSGQTRFFMEARLGQQWQLWLNDFSLHNGAKGNDALYWENNWYLSGDLNQEFNITVAAETLDLQKLQQWVINTDVVPTEALELLSSLNPQGNLNNVALRLYPSRKPFDVDLSATLQNVSVDAWDGAPLAANINGQLRTGLFKGYFDLDAENFILGFPELFREVWTYDTAKTRLYWDVADNTYILKSDHITLTAPEGTLNGKLRLDIPLSDPDAPMDMALTVGISDGDARYTPQYLPTYLPMDKDLVGWIRPLSMPGLIPEVFCGMVPLWVRSAMKTPAGGSFLILIRAIWITV